MKLQTTVLVMSLLLTTGILGYTGKMNAENILYTLAGAVAGIALPQQSTKD